MSAAWLLVALPIFVLATAIYNLIVWPRRGRSSANSDVSVLVPARNEADGIESCVRSIAAQQAAQQIVVYEDRSSDDTRDILRRLEAEFDQLTVVDGEELPNGWVGKPRACSELATCAVHNWLLFVDADVVLSPTGISRLFEIAHTYDAAAVTAVPKQEFGSWFERLVVPLLHLTYVAWLPLNLIWKTDDPRLLAANGQVLLVRRDAYDLVGGFETVKDAVVDDMAFCAALKRQKQRVVFADGFEIASCRMYRSSNEVWRGFSKNIFEGVGSLPLLCVVLTLYTATFVAPYFALAGSPVFPQLFAPALVAVAINVAFRVLLTARFAHPIEGVLFHPLSVIALLAIAINSAKWHYSDHIEWAGRVYPKRGKR